MPRDYKRKTANSTTPLDVMLQAVSEITDGAPIRSTAQKYNIDRLTLTRFKNKQAKIASGETPTVGWAGTANAKRVFTSEMEFQLANHIKNLADTLYGLSVMQCRELAYNYAKANNISIPKSWETEKRAGKDWLFGFRKRNSLSVRTPEARAYGFNRPAVNNFYDKLGEVMDRYKFQSNDIYNTDETGFTTVHTPKGVVVARGIKQIGSIIARERGELVTMVGTVSAGGNAIPPLFIFPKARYQDHFLTGDPAGSLGTAGRSGSGWMTSHIFSTIYFPHFVQHSRATKERPVLLILDNHESHVSIEALTYARDNGVVMLALPPHCSHRLQPLDRTIYGPLKTNYNRALDGFCRSNIGQPATIYNIPGIVKTAYDNAMTHGNITSGFSSCGIYPYNRDIFQDSDSAPATVSERANPSASSTIAMNVTTTLQPQPSGSEEPQPACSEDPQSSGSVCVAVPLSIPPSACSGEQQPSTSTGVTPEQVLPIPHYDRAKKQARNRVSAIIIDPAEIERVERLQKQKKPPQKITKKATVPAEISLGRGPQCCAIGERH